MNTKLTEKCFRGMDGAYAAMFTPIGKDNRVVELMIESDNWSYRKAMMKFVGIDCGPYRKPFEPLTAAQYRAYAKRFAALGIARENQAKG